MFLTHIQVSYTPLCLSTFLQWRFRLVLCFKPELLMVHSPSFHLVPLLKQRSDQNFSALFKLPFQDLCVILHKLTEYCRVMPSSHRRRYIQLLYQPSK